MSKLKSWKNWNLILICICINIVGKEIAAGLDLPLWLDSVGTFVAAIMLGPLAGSICGVAMNLIMGSLAIQDLPYFVVSIAIGVSASLFYPKHKKSYLDVLNCGVLTGLVASIISTPINLFAYGGKTGNAWGDSLIDMLSNSMKLPFLTSFIGQIFVDIPDKVISLYAALMIIWILKKNHKMLKANNMLLLLIIPTLLFPSFGMTVHAADFGSVYAGTTFDLDSGLGSQEVTSIVQTKGGYIWVGTYSGLYRYDGHKFKAMNLDERLRNVTTMFVDSNDMLWIGTYDNGVARYDEETGTVKFYSSEQGLSSDVVRAIAEDKQGNIYIGTASWMCRIRQDDYIETYVTNSFYGITDLCRSGDTMTGVRSDGSLVVFNDLNLMYVIAGDYTTVAKGDGENYIVGTGTSLTGKLLVGEGRTDVQRRYSENLSYFNKIVYSEDFKGYFVCCENGFGFVSDNGTTTILTTDDFDSSIVDAMIDYQGNVWFASSKQGIRKYSWNPFEDIFSKANLKGEVVYSTLVKDGQVYAGTGSGLYTIDLKTYYSVPIPNPAYLKGVRINNIMCDNNNNLWFSTVGANGLIEMHPDKSILTFTKANGMIGEQVFFSKQMRDGRIYVATNAGLCIIRGEHVVKTLNEYDGISNRVQCMYENIDGTIYAGTDGDGIYIIRNDSVVGSIGQEDGLETMVVQNIVPCTDGLIYVTSNALFYDNNKEIKRLDAFPYSNNSDVYITDDKIAWVLSSAGIYILDEKDLLENAGDYDYTLLNRGRGLQTSITSNGNYWVNSERLYLPCADGIRRISTTNYDQYNNDYFIKLADLTVGDESIMPENGVYTIPSSNARVEFDVAVMNYTLSNPLVHMYLNGSDDEGITVYQKNLQSLTFTNLPNGEYELIVEILDSSGKNVIRQEKFPVIKEAQLYETKRFQIYLTLVIVAFIGYIGAIITNIIQGLNNAKKLEQEANRDPLTGLLNKRGAREYLEPLCSTATGFLAVLDLDSFKLVNDLYGHDMGDRVLIEFAEIFRKYAGEKDVLCRTGGDEFEAFFNETRPEKIEKIAENYNEDIIKMAKRHMGDEMNIPIGISMGVAPVGIEAFADDDNSYESLFKKADRALYLVKNKGKHGCLIYKKDMSHAGEDDERSTNLDGLAEVRKVLQERSEPNRAYRADKERMQDIYRILYRMHRNELLDTCMVRFKVHSDNGVAVDEEIMNHFMDILKDSLRSSDVYGIDSSDSAMVLLVSLVEHEANTVIFRIIQKWGRSSASAGYSITYEKEML